MTFFGALLIVLGLVAIAAPFITGVSMTLILGLILVAAGITQIAWAFRSPSFKGGIGPFVWGSLSGVAGLYTLSQPATALAVITLVLAGYFFVSGVYEVWLALQLKPQPGWGWTLFGGAVTLVLAVMIWRRFPTSASWLVGTLVGVKLIVAGWTVLQIRSVTGAVSDAIKRAESG